MQGCNHTIIGGRIYDSKIDRDNQHDGRGRNGRFVVTTEEPEEEMGMGRVQKERRHYYRQKKLKRKQENEKIDGEEESESEKTFEEEGIDEKDEDKDWGIVSQGKE